MLTRRPRDLRQVIELRPIDQLVFRFQQDVTLHVSH